MDLSKLSDYRYPYRQVQLKGQNKRTSSNKNYSWCFLRPDLTILFQDDGLSNFYFYIFYCLWI